MSLVEILNVNVLQPQASFLAPYQFEITFECLEELQDDLEFKLIYACTEEAKDGDQELDSLLVGPIPKGVNKFTFEASAPDASKIPKDDLLDVSVILLKCLYKEKVFARIGYYVNNVYADEDMQASPPEVPVVEKIQRSILDTKPRVTRYTINWDDPSKEEEPPVQAEVEANDKDAIIDDEEDADDEEADDEDDDAAEVDLAMTEEQDEADLMTDNGSSGEEELPGPDDDEKMAIDDNQKELGAHPAAMAGTGPAGMEVE
ncbi:Histone chaperone asf1 [Coemansia sp. RSA 552]|nr:Histone chaperone asf1 [Coemansia sp. RSA 552]